MNELQAYNTLETLKILEAAREKAVNHNCSGAYAKSAFDRPVGSAYVDYEGEESKFAVSWCAMGAVRSFSVERSIENHATLRLSQAARYMYKTGEANYNLVTAINDYEPHLVGRLYDVAMKIEIGEIDPIGML